MTGEDYGDIWVCTDCYFAHHYGAHKEWHDVDLRGSWVNENTTRVELWYAGEDDEPVGGWHEIKVNGTLDHNREPLGLLEPSVDVSDNTCSDHYYGQGDGEHECPICDDGWISPPTFDPEDWSIVTRGAACWVCDGDGKLYEPCAQCHQVGDENGIQEFSWSRCQGCGSPLGGHRYRLHLWMREEVKA